VAGSKFVQQKGAKATKHYDLLLKKGDVLPEFPLESLDGSQVGSGKLLAGKKTVLMFFTSDCGHCVKAIERWDSAYIDLNMPFQIIGISYETLDKLRGYKLSRSVGFPFYRDPDGEFTGQHKIQTYPTFIGVDEKGRIAFVDVGNWPHKPVRGYLKLL
ncbi:MAG: peroxiredoxin family protein, partial [Limisphaerales bacterium]